MATFSVGAAGKSNALTALFQIDFEETFAYLVGEEGKLTKFLDEAVGTEDDVIATSADWGYGEHRNPVDTLNQVGVTSGMVTFAVTNINQWEPNAVLMHGTSLETMVVDTVDTSSSTVTVIARQRGSNAATSWTTGDELFNIGQAYEDGASIVSARMVVDIKASNFVQLFWENIEIDGTTLAINEKRGMYAGDFKKRKRGEKFKEFMQKIDYAAMFGESVDAATNSPRTMGGIVNFIATTETATITTLTEAGWEQHLESKGWLYGSADQKIALTSYKVAGGMNRWATAKFALPNVGGKEYGYQLQRYTTPLGNLKVMPHFNLSNNTSLQGNIIIVDLHENVKRKTLRPMKMYGDIDTGTRDVQMDAWMWQGTFTWGHPRHHSRVKGITAISA